MPQAALEAAGWAGLLRMHLLAAAPRLAGAGSTGARWCTPGRRACAPLHVHAQGQEGKLDAVVCLLGTFSHMTTNDMAAGAFGCAARHLRPGGMLLLELAHPGAGAAQQVVWPAE